MWATLGDIAFDVLEAPEELSATFAQDYAQHATIEGAPKLQWIGRKLQEISFKLRLTDFWTDDPGAKLEALKAAAEKHQPLGLIMGDGDSCRVFDGKYVITELTTRVQQQSLSGHITRLEIDLTLLEWIADQVVTTTRQTPPKAKTKPKARKGAPGAKTAPNPSFTETTKNPDFKLRIPSDVTRQPRK